MLTCGVLAAWKARARALKIEVQALYLASRDPRVPWYTKLFAAGVVAYALSPIDLIPDFVPILGYVDDLVLVPLGVVAVRRLVPPAVLAECRARAAAAGASARPKSWAAAGVIVAVWLGMGAAAIAWWVRSR